MGSHDAQLTLEERGKYKHINSKNFITGQLCNKHFRQNKILVNRKNVNSLVSNRQDLWSILKGYCTNIISQCRCRLFLTRRLIIKTTPSIICRCLKFLILLLILTTVQISTKTVTNNFSDNGFYIFMSIKGIVNCKINRYQMISNSLIYKYVRFLNIFIIQVIKSEQ